jgi:hypothetical protein
MELRWIYFFISLITCGTQLATFGRTGECHIIF